MALDSYLALDGFTQGTSGPGTLSPVSHPTPSSSRGNNPLTTKLSTVLSTSYSDADFREALALLDERGVGNDARTRRRIRLDVHKEVISSNSLIVDEFGRVADQLRQIRTTLGKLNAGYDKMKNEVLDAHKETSPAMLESASLLEQREQVETKQRVLATFKDHFLMSDDEVASLTSTAEPVDDRFFDALSKAKSISQNCEILLGFERQTLGSDLMEQSSKNINFGFQKLYKWVQREFKTLNLENPQMNTSIRRALRVLAGRPSLFQNCLDFFAEARDRILSDSFQVALTGTNASGAEEPSIKPIDLTAHDPLRYVGDMLAWVHSATVSEREALEVLFVAEGDELAEGLRSGRDAEIWRLVIEDDDENQDDFNALKALGDLVDRNVAGAARALRQRVEQVIRSNEETITAYKLAMLIKFYRITFHKLLGPKAGLVDCAASLEEEALRQYRSLVRDHIAALQGEFQHAPPDLGPPAFLSDALRQLGTIMKTYESSLSAAEDRESDFKDVLAEAFEPFLAGCENMARPLQAPGDAIFLINCRRAAIKCLEVFDFTKQRATRLRQSIEHELEDLVGDQHLFFCTSSGLGPLLGSRGEGRFESGAKHLTKDALARASQQLDDFLPSAMMDAMERLKRLQDTTLARHATEEAASRFCRDFRDLELEIEKIDDRDVSQGADELGLSKRTRVSAMLGLAFPSIVILSLNAYSVHHVTIHKPIYVRVKAMLRNKAFTVLQKTYDDSYLSCSTAVYYESQGDEIEAMRHWRSALEQIYEHRAKAAPGYGPQTDTERALVDALRELELQCKERIDLLEALRASRSEGASPSPGTRLSKTPPEPYRPVDRTKGSIGQGTIPAVTYSELSRPSIPSRPSLPARTSSEVGLSASVGARLGPSSSNNDLHRTNSPKLPPRPDKAVRSPSPEKHTMRTTLRSGRMGEKPQKTARISPKPIAEGPSKAATLAWTALGSRERALKPSSDGATASQFLSPRKSSDGLPRPGPSQNFQWDSHSRRLVTPRDPDHFSNGSQAIGTPRHSDEYSRGRPSLLSKHSLSSADIKELVQLTEAGFSGSDITALAKDAAMGPLRSLGEALLHMTMDQIRPIMLDDFKASLGTIRPSVGKAGLKEYEDWAREFGERGG
ncbi:Golgi transport complex subunit 6 [Purpureocillium lilacinum]|uniref:Golgi transport complex subunit 6 n=1 Tax=Purpureocillium lilacinum TaxID=33203 RepID=UPI00208D3D0A|nr:Golgi transport complex subunit 6 [Purpureocillium lilacinum]GJN82509.1 Golgi transport complex subunit 6 [Purpureocillium lilacinum]